MRISVASLLFVFLLLVGMGPTCSAAADVAIPWLGENLVADDGFELTGERATPSAWLAAPRGTGAAADRVEDVHLTGTASFRLALPESDTGVSVRSTPVPVRAGCTYLVSVACRQAGFNTLPGEQNQYQGVSSWWTVEWRDPQGRAVAGGRQPSGLPYGPCGWRVFDAFVQAPDGASDAVFVLSVGNHSAKESGRAIPSTVWLDNVQMREYRPPPTPAWAEGKTERVVDGAVDTSPVRAHFVASSPEFTNGRGGEWSVVTVDPDAERGAALVAPADTGAGLMAHSPYWGAMPAGLYRLRVRAKLTDPAATQRAGYVDIDSSIAGARLLLEIQPRLFPRPNEYQVLEKDFVVRDNGWWDIRLYTDGNQSWAVDSVKVVPLADLQDRQLLAIYPGIGGEIEAALKPRRGMPYKVLVVAGLQYDRFRPEQALRLLAQSVTVECAWLNSTMFLGLRGFPDASAELFDCSAVVLANVPAKVLSLRQKNCLAEYVRRGGALVLLGGDLAFERGGMSGSLLEEVLPLESTASVADRIVHRPAGLPLTVAQDALWLRECDFSSRPRVYFLHRVGLRPGAEVFVRAGQEPFLVGGACGAGRVVCGLGWPYGDPAPGATAFWAWSDWVYLLRNAVLWAMQYPVLE